MLVCRLLAPLVLEHAHLLQQYLSVVDGFVRLFLADMVVFSALVWLANNIRRVYLLDSVEIVVEVVIVIILKARAVLSMRNLLLPLPD